MKLSDAIRLGSMNGPQAFGETRNRRGGTCALGAALDAIGKRLEYHHALEFWPLLMKEVPHPGEGDTCTKHGEPTLMLSVIRILNDAEKWSRPRIADWVETIEAQQEAEQSKLVETPVSVE